LSRAVWCKCGFHVPLTQKLTFVDFCPLNVCLTGSYTHQRHRATAAFVVTTTAVVVVTSLSLYIYIYIYAHTKCTCIIPVNCPAFPEVVGRSTLVHPHKFVATHHQPLPSCKPHEFRTAIIVTSSSLPPARSVDTSRRTLTVLSEFSVMT